MTKSILIAMCLLIAVQAYERRNLKFETFPPTLSWPARRCAIHTLGLGMFRGAKFDNQSGSCETLPESWFSNSTRDRNEIYFKLQMMEHVFTPALSLTTEIPANFVMDTSMEFLVKTGDNTDSGYTNFDIGTKDNQWLCFHIDFRNVHNMVVLNTMQMMGWNEEIIKYTKPLSNPNTEYKLELRITESAIQVYIDGGYFVSYDLRVSFFDCNMINFGNNFDGSVKLQQLKFLYPI